MSDTSLNTQVLIWETYLAALKEALSSKELSVEKLYFLLLWAKLWWLEVEVTYRSKYDIKNIKTKKGKIRLFSNVEGWSPVVWLDKDPEGIHIQNLVALNIIESDQIGVDTHRIWTQVWKLLGSE